MPDGIMGTNSLALLDWGHAWYISPGGGELPYGNDGGARRWFWYCLLRVSKVPQREFFAVRFRDGLDTMRSSVMRKLGVFIDEKLSADELTKSVVIHHSIIFITLSESKNIYRVTPQRPYINSCVRFKPIRYCNNLPFWTATGTVI